MRLYQLNEKALSIKGNNVPGFLNGLTSNALEAPNNAFLNQHGRIIATFRMLKMAATEAVISVPSIVLENLLNHLARYARLSQIKLEALAQAVYIDLDTKGIVLCDQLEAEGVSEQEFLLFRLENNMPLMGVDYKADEFILNVDEFAYTSYTKGCFLGQEPVAKVHNRSKPSKKLMVQFEDQCSKEDKEKMTSKVFDAVAQKNKGFIFVSTKEVG